MGSISAVTAILLIALTVNILLTLYGVFAIWGFQRDAARPIKRLIDDHNADLNDWRNNLQAGVSSLIEELEQQGALLTKKARRIGVKEARDAKAAQDPSQRPY